MDVLHLINKWMDGRYLLLADPGRRFQKSCQVLIIKCLASETPKIPLQISETFLSQLSQWKLSFKISVPFCAIVHQLKSRPLETSITYSTAYVRNKPLQSSYDTFCITLCKIVSVVQICNIQIHRRVYF